MERDAWWARLLQLMQAPFSLTPKQLTTFMRDGVAAAMERDAWWARLVQLTQAPFSLTPKQLATFMCDGVAARLCVPAFSSHLATRLRSQGTSALSQKNRKALCKAIRPESQCVLCNAS